MFTSNAGKLISQVDGNVMLNRRGWNILQNNVSMCAGVDLREAEPNWKLGPAGEEDTKANRAQLTRAG